MQSILADSVVQAIRINANDTCDVVKRWLSSNPQSVNARDFYDRTALRLAARNCNIEVAKLLLEGGAGIQVYSLGW